MQFHVDFNDIYPRLYRCSSKHCFSDPYVEVSKCHLIPVSETTHTILLFYFTLSFYNFFWLQSRKQVVKETFLNTFNIFIYADVFIQSDLQCIQVIHLLSVCVFSGD